MAKDRFEFYESPLVTRNASLEMSRMFGMRHRIGTWRQLWWVLADEQRRLGLDISLKQVRAMEAALDDIDFRRAARYERKLRHDVMAHVHTFGDRVPAARGIIHLGATSAYVVDNADLVIMRSGLKLILSKLLGVVDALAGFSAKHRRLVTLGYTHGQPAQPTTVGKRATLWCYDFVRDLEAVDAQSGRIPFLGVKGTTGTQASFLDLFGGDHRKVDRLDRAVALRFDFDQVVPVSGQTYSRKIDAEVIAVLGGIASSVHKICNDLRLLANFKEIEEPFEKTQVGSSAMAYKRNPMRCERATALARHVISLVPAVLQTHAEQWFERSLDDSAHKRISIPEAFLATDGMLNIMLNVTRGLVVYPRMIAARVAAELPFMATEEILMAGVAAGGNRQDLHERIRHHSMAAAARVKVEGLSNDLVDRLKGDPAFHKLDWRRTMDPQRFTGRAAQQVDEFLAKVVRPLKRRFRSERHVDVQLHV